MNQLSILIITYNREEDTLLLLQNLIRQNDYHRVVKEILLLNNNSTTDYTELSEFVKNNTSYNIKYYEHSENLGVARGRNFLIPKAQGQYLLIIDDDMEFEDSDALIKLRGLLEKDYAIENNIQLITFGVDYFETRERQQNAFPHKKYEKYLGKDWFLTYYFAGGAHVVNRDVFTKIGLYPEDFFYGMEEYDLAYRMIQAGYRLGYDEEVHVLHKESPKGRMPNKNKLGMLTINKSKVAWRYLPKKYYYSTMFLWGLNYLKGTKGDVFGLFKIWKKCLEIPKSEKRTPLNTSALNYLKSVEARLHY